VTTLRTFKADLFRTLANPVRIQILEELRSGALTVSELHTRTGAEPSNVSQHLAILRSCGVVNARRDGNNVWYSVTDPAIFELLAAARQFFERQLAVREKALGDEPAILDSKS
jgi:DNA-binding transcriptional ArsR family regulator